MVYRCMSCVTNECDSCDGVSFFLVVFLVFDEFLSVSATSELPLQLSILLLLVPT